MCSLVFVHVSMYLMMLSCVIAIAVEVVFNSVRFFEDKISVKGKLDMKMEILMPIVFVPTDNLGDAQIKNNTFTLLKFH